MEWVSPVSQLLWIQPSLSLDGVMLSYREARGKALCILSGRTFTTVGPCSPEKGHPKPMSSLLSS